MSPLSRCPRCGYWAFDGAECYDCGYRPGARIGRRGFISLALGAAAAAAWPFPGLDTFDWYRTPLHRGIDWGDGKAVFSQTRTLYLRPAGVIRSLEPFVYEPGAALALVDERGNDVGDVVLANDEQVALYAAAAEGIRRRR
jgi:hypothetical protein